MFEEDRAREFQQNLSSHSGSTSDLGERFGYTKEAIEA